MQWRSRRSNSREEASAVVKKKKKKKKNKKRKTKSKVDRTGGHRWSAQKVNQHGAENSRKGEVLEKSNEGEIISNSLQRHSVLDVMRPWEKGKQEDSGRIYIFVGVRESGKADQWEGRST
jgi:hypothetical protein